MSRGGRGGGRGGRGGMHRNPLPFEVDQEVFEGADSTAATGTPDENAVKQLFPPIDMPTPRPVTAEERTMNRIKKELHAETKKSVWWTGTQEQLDGIRLSVKDQGKRPLDAFDSMETYSKKKRAKPDAFVPVEKRKFPRMNPELTPAELLPADPSSVNNTKKPSSTNGAAGKKSVSDRLANINENKDDDAGGDDNDNESLDGGAKAGDDGGGGEDAASEPQDSEFEEDEADDADNDYNAENYFSGGEGDDGSVGGEDADDGFVIGCLLYERDHRSSEVSSGSESGDDEE